MIALDTNVLLRYLLWDDEKQAIKADALINDSTTVLVTDVVLAETLATPQQLNNFEFLGDGEGIHWPDLDEDLSVSGLLRGTH